MDLWVDQQLRLFVGKVHAQDTSIEVGARQSVHRILSRLLIGELAEAEALRAVGLTIVNQTNIHDLSGAAEVLTQVILGGVVRQVANVDRVARSVLSHFFSFATDR